MTSRSSVSLSPDKHAQPRIQMVYQTVEVSGLLYAAFLATPFALVLALVPLEAHLSPTSPPFNFKPVPIPPRLSRSNHNHL